MNTVSTQTGASRAAPGRRRRLLVLAICSVSLLIVGLDVTIVNVALPSIGRSFRSALPGLQWTVDAYTLVLASLLMLSGSAADRFGRRRAFLTGLVLFSAGSLACALAPGLGLLVAFRALQAVGGAMLSPSTMAIVRNTFTDPRERAQAIGVFAAMFGISMALGPVLGGFLVSAVSWRAVFVVNLPVGLAAIAPAARFVPESLAPRPRRLDLPGQVLVIAALAALTYAVIEGGRAGFGTARIVILLAVAAGCLAGLVPCELRRAEPLLEVRFFASAPFAGASAIAVCLSAALGGFLLMNTLYLQDVRGLPALHAGLCMLPTAAMMIVFAPVSGYLTGRFGARPSMCAGGLAVMASGLMLTGLAPGTPLPYLLGAYAVFGLGFALVSPPIASTAVSGMPPAQAGVASAVATTSRQVGITLGVAVFGVVAGEGPGGQISLGFAHSTRPGWWIVAALGLTVAALGYLTTTGWARGTAAPSRRAPSWPATSHSGALRCRTCVVGQQTATRSWMETIMQALRALVRDGTLAGEWVLDSGRSSIRLKTRALGLRVNGVFSEIGGTGTVSADGEVSGTIAVAVASIDTGNSKRDTHLRSAEIFDSANYPHITVTVDGIRPSGQGVAVTGTLTVRDRTLPLSFDAAVSVPGNEEVWLDAETRVSRADFGLGWKGDGLASKTSTLIIHTVFTRR